MKRARCRSCAADIVWARASKSGKWLPFDAEPNNRGTFTILVELGATEPSAIPYRDFRDSPLAPLYLDRYTPHWATCPHANTHRRTP